MIQKLHNQTPGNIPQRKHPVFMIILIGLIILRSGFELFRVFQYVLNLQFLLTITSPIQIWLLANLAFILFAGSLPIFAGLIIRSSWAAVWSIRYLAFSTMIEIGRTILFSTDPLAPIHWLSIGSQVLFTIILITLLFLGYPRKVVYADK